MNTLCYAPHSQAFHVMSFSLSFRLRPTVICPSLFILHLGIRWLGKTEGDGISSLKPANRRFDLLPVSHSHILRNNLWNFVFRNPSQIRPSHGYQFIDKKQGGG